MKYRTIPGTNIQVSIIGFGGGHLGAPKGGMTPRQWLSLLNRAFDAGINLFDTAPSYTLGFSERLLGRFIKDRRDKVVIITKGGYQIRILPKLLRISATFLFKERAKYLQNWLRSLEKEQNFHPKFIKDSLEKSLRRLGTDYIDIFLLHSPPLELLTEEWWTMLDALRREGKIRYYGFSTSLPSLLSNLDKYAFLRGRVIGCVADAFEIESYQSTLGPLNLQWIIYSPFGAGRLLQVEKQEILSVLGRRIKYATDINLDKRDLTKTQLVLTYLLSSMQTISVVVGTSKNEHLNEMVKLIDSIEFHGVK